MKQVIVIKLEPSQEQHQALLRTVEAFNQGCQYAADVAYEKRLANKIALQPFVYGTLRSEFGLSSLMAIRAIAKAVEAYKRDRRVHVKFDVHGAMVYDPRIMSFKGLTQASLMCLSGRELIPMRYGAYQAARIDRAKGQADLILKKDSGGGTFYLYVTVDLPSAPPVDAQDVLGVDLGIAVLAMDSDGEAHPSGKPRSGVNTGAGVKQCRRRFQRLRQGLQSCGSKSARRHLKRIRQKESRYQRWVNHNISRYIVNKALVEQRAVALEDLRGIRERVSVRKTQRYESSAMRNERFSWAFAQLRAFLAYKCEAAGIPLIVIDPRDTSRTCLACGHCAKENRHSQSEFLCEQCGFQANADFVGSMNIRRKGLEARAVVTRPMDALSLA